MDRIQHHFALCAAEFTDEDLAATQREQLSIVAAYLRALGSGMLVSTSSDNHPATILLAAADVLDRCVEQYAPEVMRDAAVSEARRCMAVADAKYQADAAVATLSTPQWWLLNILAQAAAVTVRTAKARHAFRWAARIAARKASPKSKVQGLPLAVVRGGGAKE